jgi:hypothetical protein
MPIIQAGSSGGDWNHGPWIMNGLPSGYVKIAIENGNLLKSWEWNVIIPTDELTPSFCQRDYISTKQQASCVHLHPS